MPEITPFFTGPMASMRPLSSLQALRGIAALLVVLVHIPEELGGRGFADPFPDMSFGNFGVDVFFVISGFIMVYANVPSFGRVTAAVPFFLRRLARIAPLYWALTTVFLLLVVWSGQDPGYSTGYVVASYLFVPYPEPQDGASFPVLFTGWTLQFEMFFYLCFAAAMMLPRSRAILVLSAAFMALLAAGSLFPLPWPLDFWSSSQLLEFMFGMILAEVYLRGLRLPTWLRLGLVAAVCVVVLITTSFLGGWPPYRGLVWGLPGAAMVSAAVLRTPGAPGPVRRFLERLGDASYSLYLVHIVLFFALNLVIQDVFRHPDRTPPLVYAAGLLLTTVGVASLTYRFFERPMTRVLQRVLAPRRLGRLGR